MQSAADVYEYTAQSSIGRAGRPRGAGLHWPVLAVLGMGAVAGTWLVARGARRDAPAWWTERVRAFRPEPPAPAVVAAAPPPDDGIDSGAAGPAGFEPSGSATGAPAPAPAAPPEPRRIGGWLILVGIGVLFTPILVAVQFAPLLGLLERTTWAVAIEQTGGRRVLMEFTLVFELFVNVILFALGLLTAISFVRRRRSFPFHYILTATASLVFITTDLVLAAAIDTPSMAVNADDMRGLMSAISGLAIWGTYVLRSKRVHETFVR
jgi:hypothetical protein